MLFRAIKRTFYRWWLLECLLVGKLLMKRGDYYHHLDGRKIHKNDWDPYTNPEHLQLVQVVAELLVPNLDYTNLNTAFRKIRKAYIGL